jgi:protein-tyrosine-phosphatase
LAGAAAATALFRWLAPSQPKDAAEVVVSHSVELNGSAGTKASFVRPEVIAVMREVGIDITGHRSKQVDEFAGHQFDYVITVCDNARETCQVFFGKAQQLHRDFEDPAEEPGPMIKGLQCSGACGTNCALTCGHSQTTLHERSVNQPRALRWSDTPFDPLS